MKRYLLWAQKLNFWGMNPFKTGAKYNKVLLANTVVQAFAEMNALAPNFKTIDQQLRFLR